MKTRILVAFLFSSAVAHALTNVPPVRAESEEKTYLREHEEYFAVTDEIERWIKSGNLKKAEEVVLLYEPKYRHK